MPQQQTDTKAKLNVSLDYRIIIAVLLLVIAGMFALWRPWVAVSDRTIEVSGRATVSATPDEFIFYPTYDFKDASKEVALAALSKKSDEIVAKLKDLGVPENKIKTSSDGYEYPIYKDDDQSAPTYTLRLTVTVANQQEAQKVQDYLVTTAPSGAVSPQATFSEAKQKELESQARDDASKDARAKAEQSAKNLGFSLGAVKSVNDGIGFGGGIVYPARGVAEDMASTGKLTVQPGENDLSYSVQVVYFVR